MKTLLEPRSVLVVGVSDRPRNLGRNIVRNLIDFGFPGEIHLFGRRPGNLFGHRILTRWEDVPEGIDLGVLLVPAQHVPETVDRLGERGIRRAVISTGGFTELGPERAGVQRALVEAARRHGIRFTGPNGLGVVLVASGLSTPFVPLTPPEHPGGIFVVAQSGGVGLSYMARLSDEALGLGGFVSLGNKLDIDETDILRYLRTRDPRLVCLYLEDIRDGRALFEELRDYPSPVLVHKTNVSDAGARAARSHTASIAADDRVVDAALRQAGAVRPRDSHTLLNDAKAFSLPPMRGDRLLILSRSGGHAVIAADLTERFGFELPPVSAGTEARVRENLRAGVIALGNPLDLGDIFDFDVYVDILEEGLKGGDVDGVVFIHVYEPGPEAAPSRRLIDTVAKLTDRYDKPVFLSLLSSERELATVRRRSRYPIFGTPEDAMRAAAVSRRYDRRHTLPALSPLDEPALADAAGIEEAIAQARRAGRRLLSVEALTVAERAGFPVASFRVAQDAAEIPALAKEVGFPLVMKILSPAISHKSDVGGVVLGVRDEAEAARAFDDISSAAKRVERDHPERDDSAPDIEIEGVLLQRMEPGLREIFLGGKQDPSFGPVVMVGLGGVAVETFNDVSLRLAPLTERDIDEMLDEVVSFKMLRGVRGLPAADIGFLRESVARMARLLVEHPDIAEIDLNPIKLHKEGEGGCVVDARILLTEIVSEAGAEPEANDA